MTRVALTVDVEPDWGVRGVRGLREVAPRLLRFLEERNWQATFFVVSDLLDAEPDLIGALGDGYEVGSHTASHARQDGLDSGGVRRELRRSRARLRSAGFAARGVRAPFFARSPGWLREVKDAGYAYDASFGSVVPGPHNARLAALGCPHRRAGIWECPTSSSAGGLLPFSLTYLRLLYPISLSLLPVRPSLFYMHLHEFLPAETACVLPAHLRGALTRNCGEKAWEIMDRALEKTGAEYTSCWNLIEEKQLDAEP